MAGENTIAATAARLERRLAVLLPLPLAGAYDYGAPEEFALAPGDFVVVPLGRREVIGVVWGEASGEVAPERLKPVLERLDSPRLPEVERHFIDWVARYTLTPPGAVLRMAMSVTQALEPPRPQLAYARAAAAPAALRLTAERRRVLALLAEGPPRPLIELALEAGVSPAVVKGLVDGGALEAIALPRHLPFAVPDFGRPGLALSLDQQRAADALRAALAEGGFAVTLLDGVTGAGKTEV